MGRLRSLIQMVAQISKMIAYQAAMLIYNTKGKKGPAPQPPAPIFYGSNDFVEESNDFIEKKKDSYNKDGTLKKVGELKESNSLIEEGNSLIESPGMVHEGPALPPKNNGILEKMIRAKTEKEDEKARRQKLGELEIARIEKENNMKFDEKPGTPEREKLAEMMAADVEIRNKIKEQKEKREHDYKEELEKEKKVEHVNEVIPMMKYDSNLEKAQFAQKYAQNRHKKHLLPSKDEIATKSKSKEFAKWVTDLDEKELSEIARHKLYRVQDHISGKMQIHDVPKIGESKSQHEKALEEAEKLRMQPHNKYSSKKKPAEQEPSAPAPGMKM